MINRKKFLKIISISALFLFQVPSLFLGKPGIISGILYAMDIDVRIKENISILDIEGEIDLYNAPSIKEMVNSQIEEEKIIHVIINLDKATYIDSSGMGALISSSCNLKQHGGSLGIINLHGSVLKVFEITKLTSFFDIYVSEKEAVKSLQDSLER